MNNTPEERIAQSIDYAKRCLQEEADAINSLTHQLDDSFTRAVDLMYHCKLSLIHI